jgi:hypothetical protein
MCRLAHVKRPTCFVKCLCMSMCNGDVSHAGVRWERMEVGCCGNVVQRRWGDGGCSYGDRALEGCGVVRCRCWGQWCPCAQSLHEDGAKQGVLLVVKLCIVPTVQCAGWSHGGLRDRIRVKTFLRLVARAGDGGALGTVSFLKASSRWSFLTSLCFLWGTLDPWIGQWRYS